MNLRSNAREVSSPHLDCTAGEEAGGRQRRWTRRGYEVIWKYRKRRCQSVLGSSLQAKTIREADSRPPEIWYAWSPSLPGG